MSELESFCGTYKPEIAVLCIPKDAAPEICEKLAGFGIRAFWNFSHYDISLGNIRGVTVENVHLGDSLMALCYGLTSAEKPKDE